MTDAELKKLAWDMLSGTVFTSGSVAEDNLLRMVFMPLALMTVAQVEDLNDKTNFLYEELSEAGPSSINGYPIFMSFKYVPKEDMDRLKKFYDEAYELKSKFVNDDTTNNNKNTPATTVLGPKEPRETNS